MRYVLKISADCVVRAAIINNYIFGDAGKSLELKRIVFKPCDIVVSESDFQSTVVEAVAKLN